MKIKFIEMSRFKVLLTGCVLLLMLNCYQSYGDNFRVYYDAQSKIVKFYKTPHITASEVPYISVELSGIQTWAAAVQIFKETQKIIKENNIRLSPGHLYFLLHNSIIPADLSPSFEFLDSIVKEENTLQKITAVGNLAYLYKQQGELIGAIRCYEYALGAAKAANNPSLETDAFLGLGRVYVLQEGRLSEAERCYNGALKAAKVAENLYREVSAVLGLGNVYILQGGRLSEAEGCYIYALAVARVANNPSLEADAFLSLGNFYAHYRPLEAERFYNDILGEENVAKDPSLKYKVFINLGNVYRGLGKSPNAEGCFRGAIETAKVAKNPFLEAGAFIDLGILYGERGEFPKAEECCQGAIEAAQAAKDPTLEAKAVVILREVQELQKMSDEPKIRENLEQYDCQCAPLPSYKELVRRIGEDPMDVYPAAESY